MTDLSYGGAVPPDALSRAQKHYFTAWRWHFYAGLYVIPFLLMLAVTGLIMLWISAFSGLTGERMAVLPNGQPMALAALEAAATAAVPGGTVTQYIEPMAADRAAVFKITAGEDATAVVVDPYTATVLDQFPFRAGWYDFASDIHGSLLLGDTGDRLIEIAASLGIVLVVTGLYLHWPRNGRGWRTTFLPDLASRGRAFWKSLHGAVGMWMSVVALVFLISGLSWAGVWGGMFVQAWSTFPAEKWDAVPLSDKTHADMNHGAAKEVPWALEQTALPESGSLAGKTAINGPVDSGSIAVFARSLGFQGRFQMNYPAAEDGVWTISHDSMSNDGNDPWRDRTLHIDRFTGNVLADVGYADYSAFAKAMAWGVAFHEGDMGLWNVALNTLFCLAMILLPLSGLVMWWRRRPEKAARLAAPPRPRDLPMWRGAALLVVAMGIAFPMAGLAITAIIGLDLLVLRHLPNLRRALS